MLQFRITPYIIIACLIGMLAACNERISTDVNMHLTYSADTIVFDTVFSAQNSITKQLVIHNENKQALKINRLYLQGNLNSPFHLNIDGVTNAKSAVEDITIYGKDSLIIFIKVYINPTDSTNPVLFTDNIIVEYNTNADLIVLEAFGQDVEILHSTFFHSDTTLLGLKPYLVYDYVAIDTAKSLTLSPGCKFYFHDEAQFVVFGNLYAQGTLEKPIVMRSDRIDYLFDQVPYRMVAGRWDGIYLVQVNDQPEAEYDINYLETQSGSVGIYCINNSQTEVPKLTLHNSLIHNFSLYGLVVGNMDADVVNCQISNCAQYCIYLNGGKHRFIHNTIASYFNNTDVRIQAIGREDVAAVYINNLAKDRPASQTEFINNIVSGIRHNNFVLATPFETLYNGKFSHCYLRNDTIELPQFSNITYYQSTDTIFNNIYYRYKEYNDYDFHLDSVSPCRDIADYESAALYPTDRLGNNRLADGKPDLGCYEYQPAQKENK